VSGVSAGALNAVLLANHTQGQEAAAAERMEEFWRTAAENDLYQSWWGGMIRGLFWKGGLYDSAPLVDYLQQEFGDVSMERKIDIGVVDIVDGGYKDFSNGNITSGGNLVHALYASVSFAGFFAPAEVFGSSYVDGAAVWDLDVFSAINQCTEQGFAHEDIVVDVVMTSSASLKHVEATSFTSIQMLFRYLEVSSFYSSMDGLLRAKFAYQGVNFRYVIAPTDAIPSSIFPLSLSKSQVNAAFALGAQDAQDVINAGATQSLDNLIHYYALKKSGDERINKHTLGSFTEAKNAGEFEEYDIMKDDYMRKYTHRARKQQKKQEL